MPAPTEADLRDIADNAIAADRLRTDPAFQRAILAMRKDAIEALIAADANEVQDGVRLRAEIKAIDSLCGQIADAIQRGTQVSRKPAAVA